MCTNRFSQTEHNTHLLLLFKLIKWKKNSCLNELICQFNSFFFFLCFLFFVLFSNIICSVQKLIGPDHNNPKSQGEKLLKWHKNFIQISNFFLSTIYLCHFFLWEGGGECIGSKLYRLVLDINHDRNTNAINETSTL